MRSIARFDSLYVKLYLITIITMSRDISHCTLDFLSGCSWLGMEKKIGVVMGRRDQEYVGYI
jgi:hypothetical protein